MHELKYVLLYFLVRKIQVGHPYTRLRDIQWRILLLEFSRFPVSVCMGFLYLKMQERKRSFRIVRAQSRNNSLVTCLSTATSGRFWRRTGRRGCARPPRTCSRSDLVGRNSATFNFTCYGGGMFFIYIRMTYALLCGSLLYTKTHEARSAARSCSSDPSAAALKLCGQLILLRRREQSRRYGPSDAQ